MKLKSIDVKPASFCGGLLVFAAMMLMPTPEGMNPAAWKVAAVTALMAIWWIAEAIPIPATGLIPIFLFPLLGILPAKQAAAPYADDVIYLFMGGFFLAVTMEKWNLHRRVALNTIKLVGASPTRLVLGFMVSTAFLSMWVSNSATAMMMVPIGLAVVAEVTGLTPAQIKAKSGISGQSDLNFGRALMLGIAYGASIGGVATIIGTPPNAILVAQIKAIFGYNITFLDWFLVGFPLALVTLFATWWILATFLFPTANFRMGDAESVIDEEIRKLGPVGVAEKSILFVSACMAITWIVGGFVFKHFEPTRMITDSTVAIGGAMLFFAWPVDLKKGQFLLDWKTAVKIPWDVVLLFGGGLAIANGFQKTQLTQYIALQFQALAGLHVYVLLTLIVVFTIALTEVTSNTATATLLVPIMGSVALAMGINPIGPMVAAAIAASYAFMLPVATPPNAVAYGSGCFNIRDMALAGLWINLASFIIIPIALYLLIPLFWGENLLGLPEWARNLPAAK
ncbi:MAG: DASS family sodium-coupled anion symporter [Desulfovibrio sp.]|jgi:sodium-dependent dicarboxylate transporter 2/3/5|nr:DASS family sodium-coupled anion symporter [Desulfovibrio sp.]